MIYGNITCFDISQNYIIMRQRLIHINCENMGDSKTPCFVSLIVMTFCSLKGSVTHTLDFYNRSETTKSEQYHGKSRSYEIIPRYAIGKVIYLNSLDARDKTTCSLFTRLKQMNTQTTFYTPQLTLATTDINTTKRATLDRLN